MGAAGRRRTGQQLDLVGLDVPDKVPGNVRGQLRRRRRDRCTPGRCQLLATRPPPAARCLPDLRRLLDELLHVVFSKVPLPGVVRREHVAHRLGLAHRHQPNLFVYQTGASVRTECWPREARGRERGPRKKDRESGPRERAEEEGRGPLQGGDRGRRKDGRIARPQRRPSDRPSPPAPSRLCPGFPPPSSAFLRPFPTPPQVFPNPLMNPAIQRVEVVVPPLRALALLPR